MTEHAPRPDEGASYEKRDIDTRKVLYFGLALIALVVLVGLAVTLVVFKAGEKPGEVSSPLLAIPQQVPTPRLQADPVRDYRAFRAREEAHLSAYGWVDRTNGVVHIPVERALALVLERGLARRPDSAGGGEATAAASSGKGGKPAAPAPGRQP